MNETTEKLIQVYEEKSKVSATTKLRFDIAKTRVEYLQQNQTTLDSFLPSYALLTTSAGRDAFIYMTDSYAQKTRNVRVMLLRAQREEINK